MDEVACSMYLADSAQTVSTPVEVWREDWTHPIRQREMDRQQQMNFYSDYSVVNLYIMDILKIVIITWFLLK